MTYQMTTAKQDLFITGNVKQLATWAIEHIAKGIAFTVTSDGCKMIEFDGNDKISMTNYLGFFVGTTVANAITELESYLED